MVAGGIGGVLDQQSMNGFSKGLKFFCEFRLANFVWDGRLLANP